MEASGWAKYNTLLQNESFVARACKKYENLTNDALAGTAPPGTAMIGPLVRASTAHACISPAQILAWLSERRRARIVLFAPRTIRAETSRRSHPTFRHCRQMYLGTGEDTLLWALANFGPVAVDLHFDWSKHSYTSGVITTPCTATSRGHGVSVVGYGVEVLPNGTEIPFWKACAPRRF